MVPNSRLPESSLADSQAWEIIEECVYAFEQNCQQGKRRRLDEYLPNDADPLLRKAVMIELIKVDLELRWKQGELRLLEQYCEQYEVLGGVHDLPPDLVYEAFRVACEHGKTDSAERFCEQYPHQRDGVLALAERSVNSSTAITRQPSVRPYRVGEQLDDFELLALLGKGAFGQVFLARQISLARQVALKITAIRGSEARTMATLEHDHIVQVFSEVVDLERNVRLLCMQYVPGTNLGDIIRQLSARPEERFNGEVLVNVIDALSTTPAIFQAGALKDRETLSGLGRVETVCWLGERLAEALAYAHEQGVLHRDIKPDNILISIYGRPMLADFNLSLDPHDVGGTIAGMFGGSLAYMSPEHLDAFNPLHPTPVTAVDERSDVYSLGIVLFELMSLKSPFDNHPASSNQVRVLEQLAEQRRRGSPMLGAVTAVDCGALEDTLHRALQPDPENRYQSGHELAAALNSAREFENIQNDLPKTNWLIRLGRRYPFRTFFMAALIPNLIGSLVNISYNSLRIVPQLDETQVATFSHLVLGYNLIVYPLCIVWLCVLAVPVFRSIWKPRREPAENEITRRRLVELPLWLAGVSCLGWLPGGIIFPAALNILAPPVDRAVYFHFAADFSISGLIALTYSYFAVETVFLRSLYPSLLVGQIRPRATAQAELKCVGVRLRIAQVLAGLIPLAGAVLLVVVGPDEVTSYGMFRILVSGLIGVGMLGFCLSIGLGGYLRRVVAAVSGG